MLAMGTIYEKGLVNDTVEKGGCQSLGAIEKSCTEPNTAKAYDYYDTAAEEEPYALYKLGQFMEQGLFEEGYRGKPNTQFAYAFYKKAIEHQKGGVREAHQKFGEYYQFGKHVNKNVGMAKRSMEEAAADGSLLAMNSLGSIFYNEDKDYYQAAEWFRKAADKGFTRAINNLGTCYEFGQGVKQDRDKAFKLYKEAAEKGYKEAMLNLAHMYF